MRPATAAALLALVAFAGCAQVLPDAGVTDTPEPAVRGPPESPPGVDTSGVTDASALLESHRRSLVDEGFVLETERTRRRPGGTFGSHCSRSFGEPTTRDGARSKRE